MRKEIQVTIRDKVITKRDLLRFDKLFWEIYSRSKSRHKNLTYTFYCEELNSKYTLENTQLESEEELLNVKRINALSMNFTDYAQRKRLNLELVHGTNSRSKLSLESDDEGWVDKNYPKFKESLEAIKPQEDIIIKYRPLLFHLCALNIGLFIQALLSFLIDVVYPVTPLPDEKLGPLLLLLRNSTLLQYAFLGLIAWVTGALFIWAPFDLIIDKLWPSVEFNFGPEHYHIEKVRRKKIAAVITLVVIPFLLQILFWAIS